MIDGFMAFIIMGMSFLPLMVFLSIFGILINADVSYPEILLPLSFIGTLIVNLYWAKMWVGHPTIYELNKKSQKYFNYDEENDN